jgi:hypothetical protein
MRLLRITTNYTVYLENFYKNRPDLKGKSYKDQYQELMQDCYGWVDFWTHALAKQGYEVWEPVANAEYMQKTWASENGISYHNGTWETDIIIEQIKKFKPNVLFVNTSSIYKSDFFYNIRKKCNTIKLIIIWCGSPVSDLNVYRDFDLILSNIPSLVSFFQTNGHQCEYICHAFEPRILNKIDTKFRGKIDFSFIGTIYKGKGYHNKREKLLKQLVKKTNLQLYSNIIQPLEKKEISIRVKHMLLKIIKTFPLLEYLLINLPKINKYFIDKHVLNQILHLTVILIFQVNMHLI